MLVTLVVFIHLAIILFNLFGLVAIPLGGWQGWRFVRRPIWRWLHLLSLLVVAAQATMGRACFLTIWQDALSNGATDGQPFVARTIDALIYWPIPLWAFAIGYILIFVYALALLWLVPPHKVRRRP